MRADDQPAQAATLPDSDLVIVKPDPADNPKQAAEKLVWSFLVLFENLVSARTLLKSLQEASLLVTPAPGQPALAKGTEVSIAEAFVKKLQVSMATHLHTHHLVPILLLCYYPVLCYYHDAQRKPSWKSKTGPACI